MHDHVYHHECIKMREIYKSLEYGNMKKEMDIHHHILEVMGMVLRMSIINCVSIEMCKF